MADAEQNVGQCKGLAILKSLTTLHRRTFRLGFIVVHLNPRCYLIVDILKNLKLVYSFSPCH